MADTPANIKNILFKRFLHQLTRKFLLLACFFVIITPQSVLAVTAEEAEINRIRGVSQFLLERANDNFFYLFEKKIERNDYLKCLFPRTYSYAASGDLRALLRSKSTLWEKTVNEDIERLGDLILYQLFIKTGLDESISSLLNDYIELLDKLQFKRDNGEFDLSSLSLGDNQQFKDIVNQFYIIADSFNSLKDFQKEFKLSGTELKDSACVQLDIKDNKRTQAAKFLMDVTPQVKSQSNVLRQNRSNLVLKDNVKADNIDTLINEWIDKVSNNENFKRYQNYLQDIRTILDEIKNSDSNVLRVILVERVLQNLKTIETKEKVKILNLDFEESDYVEFRRYLVFFAEIAEADTAEKTISLLEEATLPPVSFGTKRNPGEPDFFVSAYLGMDVSKEESEDDNNGGLMAPVGLEYVLYRYRRQSISLMVAPFDFAYPINLELHNNDTTVSFSDVVVPGVYLTYGLKNLPFAVGLGYRRVQSVINEEEDTYQVNFYVAFDLPLLVLD